VNRTGGQQSRNRATMRLISGRLRARRQRVAEPLRRGVFLVPATVTSLGLLAGFYSLISSINGHFEVAAVLIAIAFMCDGLDGRIARASRTSSQFGLEYDSLSDIVAFGVAPAALVYMKALKPMVPWSWTVCGIFVVCAGLRLARFNVQVATTDKRRFVGLAVPAAAAVIASGALAYSYFELESPRTLAIVSVAMTLVLAGLMISRVPYPSFKTLDLRQRAPVEIVAIVLVAIALAIAIPQVSAFAVSIAYMLSGPILYARGERIGEVAPILRPVDPSTTDSQSKPSA
jgi:CDP-diacylglycerol--serine O-phosphatidyltransferase